MAEVPVSRSSSTKVALESVLKALRHRDANTLEKLLLHVNLPEFESDNKFTALHTLFSAESCFDEKCKADVVKCTELLVRAGANVNGRDLDGNVPLYLAVENGWHSAAKVLLKYKADTTVVLRNQKTKRTLANYIAVTAPDVFLDHLSSTVQLYNDGKGNEKLSVDFGVLVQFPAVGPHRNFRETEFLYRIVKSDQTSKLFKHPVVQLFLRWKYSKLRTQIFLSILLHVLTIIFFTTFIFNVYVTNCPYGESRDQDNVNGDEEGGNETSTHSSPVGCDLSLTHQVLASVLAVIWLIMIVPELQALQFFRLGYFTKSTLPWLILYVLWPFTLWPAISQHNTRILTWRYPYAAATMFLVWALSILELSKVETFAVYCEMFAKVSIKIGKLSILFAPLFTGFCLSFFVMDTTLKYKIYSFIGLLSQMVGGPEYESIFPDNSNDSDTYTAIAVALYIFFMLLMCIVFINFLLALTTGDVEKLWAKAEKATIQTQVQQVYLFDRTSFASMKRMFFKENDEGNRWDFTCEFSLRKANISKDLLKRLKKLVTIRSCQHHKSFILNTESAPGHNFEVKPSPEKSIEAISAQVDNIKEAIDSLTATLEALVAQEQR